MKRKHKKPSVVVVISLILALTMVGTSAIASASNAGIIESTPDNESIHEKVDISDITGEIAEPPELTSAASSVASEKKWYEYVYYSSEPVGYYYLTDATRIAFYDPYDYADALVMEVDDSITDWSSMNTLQVSYTTGNSITNSSGVSSNSSTSVQVVEGQDVSDSYSDESVVHSKANSNSASYNKSKSKSETESTGSSGTIGATETVDGSWSVSSQVLGEISAQAGSGIAGFNTKTGVNVTTTQNYGAVLSTNESITTDHSTSESQNISVDEGYSNDISESVTISEAAHSKIVSTIADRTTTATGYSVDNSFSMTTNNSTTITKTYDASHFNANGSPLQWKVVKYTVQMPMKYQVQYLIDDEWVFSDYSYCLLTTIQGTTRAWLQNNVAYYEHWGTGEAVTWDEFWSQFFTPDSLIQAYQDRLYPDT